MKGKNLKRMLCAGLAVTTVLSMMACGNGNTNTNNNAGSDNSAAKDTTAAADNGDTVDLGKSFTIGFPTAPSNTASMAVINSNREGLAEAAGGKCVTEVFDFTPEGTINAVQKLIEQDGCDGVMVTPVAESVLIPIMNMCEEYGVYWVTSMRNITDEDILAQLQASQYYLGGACQDNYSLGYAMGEAFAKAGGKNYGIISNEVTDTSASLTEAGLAAAAEEFGLAFVDGCECRGASQASDVAQSVESWISTYPELDGILRLSSTATGDVSAVCETIEKLGKADDILFFSDEADDACLPYLEKGTLNGTFYDVLFADAVVTADILINQIKGTPLTDSKELHTVDYQMCDDYEQLAAYYEYVAPSDPKAVMTAAQYQEHFFKFLDDSVTFDSVWDFANNLKPLDVKALQEAAQ